MSDAFPYVVLQDAFTPTQLDYLTQTGDMLLAHGATDLVRSNVSGLRHCALTWIGTNESKWTTAHLSGIAKRINDSFYQFDLDQHFFVEPFQYAVYQEGDLFDWHMDKRVGTIQPRKLSISVQLSDPSEYEGGDLELMYGKVTRYMSKRRGDVIAFPSWTMHRVTPVTKGIRKSLVAWCVGPAFK